MKQRVLIVGRSRYPWPVPPAKFDALRSELDIKVLATSADGSAHHDSTFTLVSHTPVLDGIFFWFALPIRISRLLREFRPIAVVCQTAYEGAAALLARRVARVPARVIVEVHGDWRTATRLYGSPARRANTSRSAEEGDQARGWRRRSQPAQGAVRAPLVRSRMLSRWNRFSNP